MHEQALTKLFKTGDIVVGETGTSGKTPTPSGKLRLIRLPAFGLSATKLPQGCYM